jgi:hypothetical protein
MEQCCSSSFSIIPAERKICMRRHTLLVWVGSLTLLMLACSLFDGLSYPAQAAASTSHLHYYGADLHLMTLATGVDFEEPQTVEPNGPWPQRTDNYCFVAVVQAMVNQDRSSPTWII